MNHTPKQDDDVPTIEPRTPVPGQDPLINPGYQPIPQDLPATEEPDPANTSEPTPPAPPSSDG